MAQNFTILDQNILVSDALPIPKDRFSYYDYKKCTEKTSFIDWLIESLESSDRSSPAWCLFDGNTFTILFQCS